MSWLAKFEYRLPYSPTTLNARMINIVELGREFNRVTCNFIAIHKKFQKELVTGNLRSYDCTMA